MNLLIAGLLALATPQSELIIEVDRSDLELTVAIDGRVLKRYPVAMGKPTDPTPLGSWQIRAIDFNPDWRSTRDGSYHPPGRSPLGQVRMRYDMPYALHGTWKPESIGTYASLGCIRMRNEDIVELSELILKDTGTWKSQSWFNNMLKRETTLFHVPLKETVEIGINE